MLIGAGCLEATLPEDEPIEIIEETITMEETKTYSFQGVLADEVIAGKQIRITTEKGDIVFELYADTAPNTVSNFVYLTQEEYYDGVRFHRREEGFVIQGGDPQSKDESLQQLWGTGGPGYKFADELDDEYGYERGTIAMANAGPNTNGSQFFVMLGDVALPKAYTVFGKVTEGMDIVDAIAIGDVMTKVVVEEKAE